MEAIKRRVKKSIHTKNCKLFFANCHVFISRWRLHTLQQSVDLRFIDRGRVFIMHNLTSSHFQNRSSLIAYIVKIMRSEESTRRIENSSKCVKTTQNTRKQNKEQRTNKREVKEEEKKVARSTIKYQRLICQFVYKIFLTRSIKIFILRM